MPIPKLNRRDAIIASSVAATQLLVGNRCVAESTGNRKFTLDLRGGSVGITADLPEQIELAHRFGFESVAPSPHYLEKLSSDEMQDLVGGLKEKGLAWGSAGLPVQFRNDDDTFRTELAALPKRAAAVKQAGGSRFGTYIMPCHDDLNYLANFRLHAERLRECAKVLKDNGHRFGLEYVGPKTLWTKKRHPFVHCMAEIKDLIAEINVDNMGVILDSWHWYTAHETVDDLKTLTNEQIVACDLNDAPAGLEIDEQIDNQRELPMATGVIDLKSFLQSLIEIGYDGPIRAEPFNKPLNAMENEAAAEATAKAMKQAFALVG